MDFKALLADQLGHFTLYDIGTSLVSMLAAAALAFLAGFIARAAVPSPREMAVSSAIMAFAVSLVRASVPVAIGLVAAVLLLRSPAPDQDRRAVSFRFAALAIGIGCGSSASLIVAALVIPLGLLLRWGASDRA